MSVLSSERTYKKQQMDHFNVLTADWLTETLFLFFYFFSFFSLDFRSGARASLPRPQLQLEHLTTIRLIFFFHYPYVPFNNTTLDNLSPLTTAEQRRATNPPRQPGAGVFRQRQDAEKQQLFPFRALDGGALRPQGAGECAQIRPRTCNLSYDSNSFSCVRAAVRKQLFPRVVCLGWTFPWRGSKVHTHICSEITLAEYNNCD